MDRRHKAPEPTENQLADRVSGTAGSVTTPIPTKNKSHITEYVTQALPLDSIEEEKKVQRHEFQARPKIRRPQTANTKTQQMSAEQMALIRSMHG